MTSKNVNSSALRHLGGNLKGDKKKAVILAVLAVVAVIVGGRLVFKRAGPAGADGATTAGAAQGEPDKTSALPAVASKTHQTARDKYVRRMERRVMKDIFAVDLELYPPVELPKPKKVPASTATRPAKAARTRGEIVRAQAKLLCLQMTIVSDTPTAIINGQVLGLGETVNVESEYGRGPLRFQVVKITSHACVVAKDGVEVKLQMK